MTLQLQDNAVFLVQRLIDGTPKHGSSVARSLAARDRASSRCEREHVLSEEEERRLFEARRPDFPPIVRFAPVTGARLGNVIGLRWRQVDSHTGIIVFG